jgi:dTDP-4-dehydrorhamnose reductase
MTLAIYGAAGQLGRELLRFSPTAIGLTRADGDLHDRNSLFAVLRHHAPKVLINCAAYNLVDRAEDEPDAAFRTNASGVANLAAVCKELEIRLVQISTDYVFGLDHGRAWPIQETDLPGPLSIYGQSKLCGEFAALAAHKNNIVVRTCGLYGRFGVGGKGGNFVETMLRVAGLGKPLKVVRDQRCTPTSAEDLARMLLQLIETDVRGIVHGVNAGHCSWYEFAGEIFRQSGVEADRSAITTAEFGAKAARPAYSVLATEKLRSFGIEPRPWTVALTDYLRARAAGRPAA